MKLLNGREEEYPHDGDAMKVHARWPRRANGRGGLAQQLLRKDAAPPCLDDPARNRGRDHRHANAHRPANRPRPTSPNCRPAFRFPSPPSPSSSSASPSPSRPSAARPPSASSSPSLIVLLYYVLGAVGRGLKAHAGLYPELIIWTPNILFQAVGFYLFYRANRK